MNKIRYLSVLTLHAVVTQWVDAKDKRQAEQKAELALHKGNAELDPITLVNLQGEPLSCRVKEIARLDWVGVRRTEVSLRFEAVGVLQLSIVVNDAVNGSIEFVYGMAYSLPISPIGSLPVLRVATRGGPVLLQVESCVLEPVAAKRPFEGKPASRDGYPRRLAVHRPVGRE